MKAQIQNMNGGAPLSRALAGGLDSIMSSKGKTLKSGSKQTGFVIGDKAKLVSDMALKPQPKSKLQAGNREIQADALRKRDDLLNFLSRAKSFKTE
jgi:hypothetical protein